MEEGSQSSAISPKSDVSNDPGKMFIGGLSWQTTAEGLRQHFEKFGELKECVVMRDPVTKRSRGFGFLTFKDPKAVDVVLNSGAQELDGKKIDPKLAVPKRAPAKMVTTTKKIFIGGLSTNTSEEDMKKYFSQFGKITETMLMFDKATQRHRGFGFVTFESENSADKACDTQYHLINNKKVEVKKAQPKEVMYSLQGGRGRAGRGVYGRGIIYPLPGYGRAPGFPGAVAGFSPFQSTPETLSYYNAAAAAYAAAYAAAAQGRGRGRGRGGYIGGYPVGFPGYPSAYMGPADQRRPSGGQYYAEYASIGSSGARGNSSREMSQLNPVPDYPDYPGGMPMNGYHQPNYGPPPASPVSRGFAPATSPGPVGVSQELAYMSASGGSGAAELGYSATSPQPAGFGPAMAF
ncbi:RNA-binding protein Musashi homolog Rbp6 isoform X3 [Nematostella vectensis]|uniref:RNA-binding protein Musashi homolog Rbp6 isoform X3 n=1 Tax=Nematostella vectensis TaxID=45351 RepID=UPI00138FD6EF|nr:RNA-binding protein Musashi homolog Rbp6 isoform X3 [Nematostella vectensis]